jgi:hypothetical protein
MFKLPLLASDVRGAFDHQQWWATAWASIRLVIAGVLSTSDMSYLAGHRSQLIL